MTAGKLFIVGTPIGNLEDITLRALRALREADLIAAEDTRRTAQLLARHGIGISGSLERKAATVDPKARGTVTGSTPVAPANAIRGYKGEHPASSIQHRDVQGVGKPPRLISYHEFNEAKRTPELLRELQQGRKIALVCDAGMPTLSDPGLRLVRAVVEANDLKAPPHLNPLPRQTAERRFPSPRLWGEGVPAVASAKAGHGEGPSTIHHPPSAINHSSSPSLISLEVIPGPSAVTMALAVSGFAGSPALFYGFLPHKSAQRRKTLSTLNALRFTLVFFESPYRLVKSLHDMRELLGNRGAVVARELTKKFEEILRGDLDTILKKLENRTVKGEITVVVEGCRE